VESSPRSKSQRRADTLAKLESEVDLWVASADESGGAYLVPLSYCWDGSTLTVATPRASRTARNLIRAGWARVALGPTRDVAWRESNELEGRRLMRRGEWLE
jgi:Pyridoxamine 5'-phosphate oxidase